MTVIFFNLSPSLSSYLNTMCSSPASHASKDTIKPTVKPTIKPTVKTTLMRCLITDRETPRVYQINEATTSIRSRKPEKHGIAKGVPEINKERRKFESLSTLLYSIDIYVHVQHKLSNKLIYLKFQTNNAFEYFFAHNITTNSSKTAVRRSTRGHGFLEVATQYTGRMQSEYKELGCNVEVDLVYYSSRVASRSETQLEKGSCQVVQYQYVYKQKCNIAVYKSSRGHDLNEVATQYNDRPQKLKSRHSRSDLQGETSKVTGDSEKTDSTVSWLANKPVQAVYCRYRLVYLNQGLQNTFEYLLWTRYSLAPNGVYYTLRITDKKVLPIKSCRLLVYKHVHIQTHADAVCKSSRTHGFNEAATQHNGRPKKTILGHRRRDCEPQGGSSRTGYGYRRGSGSKTHVIDRLAQTVYYRYRLVYLNKSLQRSFEYFFLANVKKNCAGTNFVSAKCMKGTKTNRIRRFIGKIRSLRRPYKANRGATSKFRLHIFTYNANSLSNGK